MNSPLPKLEQMKDILDIKSIEIWDLTTEFMIFLAIVVLLLAGLIFYFVKKRWGQKKEDIVYKTPIERAMQRLNELVQRGLIEGGQVQKFFFTLSEIFRNFLEEELRIPANEATFEELRKLLKESPDFIGEELTEAFWLLELCEMAKFARFVPKKEDIVKSVKTCRILMSDIAQRRVLAQQEEQEGEEGLADFSNG